MWFIIFLKPILLVLISGLPIWFIFILFLSYIPFVLDCLVFVSLFSLFLIHNLVHPLFHRSYFSCLEHLLGFAFFDIY